ncbi:hypothetical protein [Paenibacillus ottowii]
MTILATGATVGGYVIEQIMQKNIENEGIDPVIATIVRLVVDGLWLSEILGVGDLDSELREKVIKHLIMMTRT